MGPVEDFLLALERDEGVVLGPGALDTVPSGVAEGTLDPVDCRPEIRDLGDLLERNVGESSP